jgi:hypothetical protein
MLIDLIVIATGTAFIFAFSIIHTLMTEKK